LREIAKSEGGDAATGTGNYGSSWRRGYHSDPDDLDFLKAQLAHPTRMELARTALMVMFGAAGLVASACERGRLLRTSPPQDLHLQSFLLRRPAQVLICRDEHGY
jgi:hypothetical protein